MPADCTIMDGMVLELFDRARENQVRWDESRDEEAAKLYRRLLNMKRSLHAQSESEIDAFTGAVGVGDRRVFISRHLSKFCIRNDGRVCGRNWAGRVEEKRPRLTFVQQGNWAWFERGISSSEVT